MPRLINARSALVHWGRPDDAGYHTTAALCVRTDLRKDPNERYYFVGGGQDERGHIRGTFGTHLGEHNHVDAQDPNDLQPITFEWVSPTDMHERLASLFSVTLDRQAVPA